MRSSLARPGAAIGALVTALTLAGCGIGLGPPAVRLVVTREFGSRVLSRGGPLKAGSNETVLGLLRAHDAVACNAGGLLQCVDRLLGAVPEDTVRRADQSDGGG